MPHLRNRGMTLPTPTLSLRTTNLDQYAQAAMDYSSHSSSTYPPSSATSDSEIETPVSPTSATFRSSISSLQDFELRTILVKLAEQNSRFQHAIMKEIAHIRPFVADTHTPMKPPRTKKSKAHSKSRRNLKNLSVSTEKQSEQQYTTHVVYHPGNLEEEQYEFLSRSPEEVAIKVVRTITMWSCCDEDELSPGCMATPSPTIDSFVHRHAQKQLTHQGSQDTDLGPHRGRSHTMHHHDHVQPAQCDIFPDDSDIEPSTARQRYYHQKAQQYHHPRDWRSN